MLSCQMFRNNTNCILHCFNIYWYYLREKSWLDLRFRRSKMQNLRNNKCSFEDPPFAFKSLIEAKRCSKLKHSSQMIQLCF